MEASPESGGNVENRHYILKDQLQSAVDFADRLQQQQNSHNSDILATDCLQVEISHIYADMMDGVRPIIGPASLMAGLALGVMKSPTRSDRIIQALISRGEVNVPENEIRALRDEVHGHVAESKGRNADQLEWLDKFKTKTYEQIAAGNEDYPGYRLLGLGMYWGATSNQVVRGTIQGQIEREYVR